MLLIPEINFKGDLLLDAYSFSSAEINCVTYVLEKSFILIETVNLKKDIEGRTGLRFYIYDLHIPTLERTLQLKFIREGEKTKVSLTSVGVGQSYRCSRIDTPPNSCETIWADDEKEAIVKCALIANNNNWLGGVPSPGFC